MKLIKFIFIIVLIIITSLPAFSQIESSVTTVSNYVWRGFDVLNGGPAFQPSMTYTIGETGLAVNAWGSWALTQRDNSGIRDLDELDFTLSYDRAIGDKNLSLGLIHYNFPGMGNWPDKFSTDTEIYAGLTFDAVKFSPGITAYYALNEDAWDGLYVNFSAGHTFETDTAPLEMSLSLGYSDQSLVTNVTDSGISDVNLGVGTVVECWNLNWAPSFTMTYVPDDLIYQDKLIFWGGLSIACAR